MALFVTLRGAGDLSFVSACNEEVPAHCLDELGSYTLNKLCELATSSVSRSQVGNFNGARYTLHDHIRRAATTPDRSVQDRGLQQVYRSITRRRARVSLTDFVSGLRSLGTQWKELEDDELFALAVDMNSSGDGVIDSAQFFRYCQDKIAGAKRTSDPRESRFSPRKQQSSLVPRVPLIAKGPSEAERLFAKACAQLRKSDGIRALRWLAAQEPNPSRPVSKPAIASLFFQAGFDLPMPDEEVAALNANLDSTMRRNIGASGRTEPAAHEHSPESATAEGLERNIVAPVEFKREGGEEEKSGPAEPTSEVGAPRSLSSSEAAEQDGEQEDLEQEGGAPLQPGIRVPNPATALEDEREQMARVLRARLAALSPTKKGASENNTVSSRAFSKYETPPVSPHKGPSALWSASTIKSASRFPSSNHRFSARRTHEPLQPEDCFDEASFHHVPVDEFSMVANMRAQRKQQQSKSTCWQDRSARGSSMSTSGQSSVIRHPPRHVSDKARWRQFDPSTRTLKRQDKAKKFTTHGRLLLTQELMFARKIFSVLES